MTPVRRLLLVIPVAAALLLAGCTASTEPPRPTATAPGVRFTTARSTVVADARAAPERAVEASRALFASSPGVVLAPQDDGAAQRSAAGVAERLHVPMLLVPGGGGGNCAPPKFGSRLLDSVNFNQPTVDGPAPVVMGASVITTVYCAVSDTREIAPTRSAPTPNPLATHASRTRVLKSASAPPDTSVKSLSASTVRTA